MQNPISATQTGQVLTHVDELCRANHTKARFFAELLDLMAGFVNAERGRLWRQLNDTFGPTNQFGDESHLTVHEACAEQARNEGTPVIRPYERRAYVGTPACCVAIPLTDQTRCFAVVTVDLAVDDPRAAEPYLAALAAIAERVGKNYVAANHSVTLDELAQLKRASELTDAIGKHLDFKKLSYEAVNRLQHYLEVDRVSLAIRRGSHAQLKGISNQAVFDRRSNVVRNLEQLASQVVKTNEPLWYPSESEQPPPSLRKLIEKYFESADSLGIALIPIFAEKTQRIDPEDIAATIQLDSERKECVAVLILEGIERPIPQTEVQRRWDRVRSPVSNSVAIARRYDSLFLLPVWQKLGAFADLYRGHTQRKAILITLAIAAVIASLIVVPSEFKVRGEGIIQPVKRQHVYAEAEGAIEELPVADGDQVSPGDLLVRLKNPELDARIAELTGKLREAESQLKTAMLQRVSRSFKSAQEEQELVRNSSNLESRISGLKEQLTVLARSQAQLEIRSPAAGQIITWDIEQRLRNRPVKPGQRLMTIAQLGDRWEVELRIPDKRSGYFLQQWDETEQDNLHASFILSSDPTHVYHGEVVEVAASSNVDDDRENVVRVRVAIGAEEFAKIQDAKPGVTVVGHVHCGRASIGYCKLYEFFDWAKRAWFKFVA